MLSCSKVKKNKGCWGGSSLKAYSYMKNKHVTDETCTSFRALGHTTGLPCNPELICSDCNSTGCKP